jgi:hypothetical protein
LSATKPEQNIFPKCGRKIEDDWSMFIVYIPALVSAWLVWFGLNMWLNLVSIEPSTFGASRFDAFFDYCAFTNTFQMLKSSPA